MGSLSQSSHWENVPSLPRCCVGEAGAGVDMGRAVCRWSGGDVDQSPRGSRELHYEMSSRSPDSLHSNKWNPRCTEEEMEARRDSVPGPRSNSQEVTTETRFKRKSVWLCPQVRAAR